MEKLVSIVVLNYNGERFIEDCIGSILSTNYPKFEVILVDNGSTDNSIKIIKKKFGKDPRLKIILNHKNLGFAEGNNIGIRASEGDYVVLLSNDTKVHPDWLKELIKVMSSNKKIGAAQSKLLLMDRPECFDSAGAYIDFFTNVFRRAYPGEKDKGQFERVSEVFMGAGIALALRKDVLNKVGIFDKDFFIYAEDLDLCWRIWLTGYKVVYVPRSIVYHAGGATRKYLPLEFHYYKNHFMCLLKNYEVRNLIKAFPIYVLSHLGIIFIGILRYKQLYLLKDFLKALLWSAMNIRSIWRKRLEVQLKIRRVKDKCLFGRVIKNTFYLLKLYAKKGYGFSDTISRFLECRRKF